MPIIENMDSLAGALAPAGVEWPITLKLWNNHFNLGVEPETCTVAEPYKTADILIKDEGQFARVLSNIDQLRAVNQWPADVGLFLLAPAKAEPVAEATADPQPTATERAEPTAQPPANAVESPAATPAPAPARKTRAQT